MRKLLKCWDLQLQRSIKRPKLSPPRQYLQNKDRGWNLVKDLEDPKPFQVWYTDFTEIWYAGGRKKAYFMPILDHKTRWIAGWAVGKSKNTSLALDALAWIFALGKLPLIRAGRQMVAASKLSFPSV